MKAIAIIPARGGSKGIPRKSIRPVAGKPMIWWAIRACTKSGLFARVVVSTDDDEIALLAERFGAEVLMRPAELAVDTATLDPVVIHAVHAAEARWNERYDVALTVQPTSPLIAVEDLRNGLALFDDPAVDTVMSVVDDRHLCWTLRDGKPVPAYAARVNRQQLPPNWRETGAVIACRRAQIDRGTRVGANVALLEVPPMRAFDIDSVADLHLCESLLARRRIVFTVTGYPAVGLGHAYRATMLAHELVRHDLVFVCEAGSELAAAHIARQHWNVEVAPEGRLLEAVLAHEPHLVVNDVLDTDPAYMRALKAAGCAVANFEDLGAGAREADLVVNALYPHAAAEGNVKVGPAWFCLRDEFLYAPRREPRDRVARILVTFGGVDEGDLTARVVRLVAPACAARGIAIDVVTGPGYAHAGSLADTVGAAQAAHPGLRIDVTGGTARISDHMFRADLAITSGGRTVLELASLVVPTLVVCQNERETTHTFASAENGVLNLGWRGAVADADIVAAVERVLDDATARAAMREAAARIDLAAGKRRVIQALLNLIDDETPE